MHLSKLDDLEPFTDAGRLHDPRDRRPGVDAGPQPERWPRPRCPSAGATVAHYHRVTEELYFFTAGHGRMTLGDEERDVGPGDCVVIPPGPSTASSTPATSRSSCCAAARPPYSHEDTVLVTDQASAG